MGIQGKLNLPFVSGDFVIVKNVWEQNPTIKYFPARIQEVMLEPTCAETDGMYEHEVALRVVTKYFPLKRGTYTQMWVPNIVVEHVFDFFDFKELCDMNLAMPDTWNTKKEESELGGLE